MFENDKGKAIFMHKRNAQHFSAEQLLSESLNYVKSTIYYYY